MHYSYLVISGGLENQWPHPAATSRNTQNTEAATGYNPSHSQKSADTKHRSRHYDPSKAKEQGDKMRLLEPHVLSSRLKKLCDTGHVDSAVSLLKNAPLDAQNTPVWNTLIWECLKAKRFQLAYQLFIDMKRRGFSPTIRTFQTLFSGLSRIEHWSNHPKQLANARSIYEAFQRHVDAVKRHEPDSPELSIGPLAAYIKLLGDAGHHQEIFEVYYNMDSEGPLAPNQFIFTAMFQALSVRTMNPDTRSLSVDAKNAADAKLLWSQMVKASKKSPGFSIDSFVVTSAIIALSRGRATDQAFAFQLVTEYFGLTAPGEPPSVGILPLSAQSLAAVLGLCAASHQHSLCIHIFDQVKKRPEALGGVSIMDRRHLEEVLKAQLALAEPGSPDSSLGTLEWMLRQEITGRSGPKIRPAISTYNLVLMACWRRVDWTSATRTFDLMTGYHAHDFMDGSVSNAPRFDKRAPGRNLPPTVETMSCMMRTALATRDRAKMRQCLRIISHLNGGDFLRTDEDPSESSKASKNRAFHVTKLASAVVETVQYVSSMGNRPSGEVVQWNKLAAHAAEVLKKTTHFDFIPVSSTRPTKERIVTEYEQAFR
ncbi:hypothetical protein BD779DRAFT_1432978 [Infundibulicybe gibba]|nr:hypothetical protein BD779DRAFT_1432978 [Infundibulicybe gibba]